MRMESKVSSKFSAFSFYCTVLSHLFARVKIIYSFVLQKGVRASVIYPNTKQPKSVVKIYQMYWRMLSIPNEIFESSTRLNMCMSLQGSVRSST